MEKKVNSKHMQNILNLLPEQEITIIIFEEKIIFDKPIEEWPIVDALIIFFSDGFPYKKGLNYVNYRNPFLINDFEMQKVFWDRRKVLSILKEERILVPNSIVVDRGEIIDNDGENNNILNKSAEIEKQIQSFHEELENEENEENKKKENEKNENYELSNEENTNNSNEISENVTLEEENEDSLKKKKKEKEKEKSDLIEFDDHIVYKGQKLYKPFVEKPSNGDDHFVYIYYPPNHGGGSKRLFRKTKNECSLFFPKVNKIRRDKSYIYEEFLQTDGFDIKVYTIGPEYAHAEARKSPALDGKVQRSSDGKEIRYPINLTPQEKEYALKIAKRFKQNICGFDILRSNGKSYVCDVNGWSFVKGNKKYYQACAFYIWKMIGEKFGLNILEKPIYLIQDPVYNNLKLTNNNNGNNNKKFEEELRSVVAVFRHADRSPKQKMKVVIKNKDILSLFDIYNKENNNNNNENSPNKETEQKEIILKKPKELMTVLKLVDKILKNKNKDSSLNDSNNDFYTKLFHIKMVLEKNTNFEGMTRKIQLKPLEYEKETLKVKKALLILKWGGTITHSGIEQAKLLGNTFRIQIYPSSLDGGILRLHSTYRHDLKCYSAEEGRCLKTAASFLKGLLQFNEPITPIITSMVSKDENISNALDVTNQQIPEVKGNIKHEISDCLNYNGKISYKFNQMFSKDSIYPDIDLDKNNKNEDIKNFYYKYPVYGVMNKIDNGYEKMKIILNLIDNFLEHLKTFLNDEEREECDTYFIKNASSISKRNSFLKNYLDLSKNEYKKDEKDKNKIQTSIKKTHPIKSSPENLELKKEKSLKQDNHSIPECEEEKEILIYKRYKKLRLDFYNNKTNKFDVTKIPDIYDNIKYDIIHNKHILDKNSNYLYENILLISKFLMPFEYGITIKEKIDIGVRIIKPLMNKIYKDLMWWNYNNPYFESNNDMKETNWSGLDQNSVDPSEIKSAWRHIKTRFYFTCASHMYALINLLVYGDNSFLLGNNKNTLYELRNIFDLDYCSHVVFRLYENFNVKLEDSKRFRLEIFMSPGCSKDPREVDENHLINVSSWIVLNNNLTFQQMKEFFSQFIDIEKDELNNKN